MRLLSRRALEELGALQDAMQQLAAHRSAALRMFITSRNTTTPIAQREFWLEFSWIDQELRRDLERRALACSIAAVAEAAANVAGRDGGERAAECVVQSVDGAGREGAQQAFDFGPDHLDRIEVR